MADKKYCDIAKAFREWILSSDCLELSKEQVVQSQDITNCKRPLIWYEQTDSERSRCLDKPGLFKPGKLFLDIEIHAEDQDAAQNIAGNLNYALERHPKRTRDFDFDGCKICLMIAQNQDDDYVIKAQGQECGNYVVGLFVELQT